MLSNSYDLEQHGQGTCPSYRSQIDRFTLSSLRKQGSRNATLDWIPAFAGMTNYAKLLLSSNLCNIRYKIGQFEQYKRECLQCEKRFTTYEYIESVSLTIVKNDKRREAYDREKLMRGICSACTKRPISTKKIESIVDKIEEEISRYSKTEIGSREIGELVMKELALLDDVAYVRFASVYRKFKDREEFVSEIQDMDVKDNSTE